MNGFNEACEIVLGHEGGYTNNPRDRGNWTDGAFGEKGGRLLGTKYGISAMTYPHLDIPSLTLDQARALYKANYWTPAGCDDLSPPLALVVFDTAVNSGVGRARQFLERTRDWGRYLDLRLDFLRNLTSWREFGTGWRRRIDTLRGQAARWEREAITKAPPPTLPAVEPRFLYVQLRDPDGTLRDDWGSVMVDGQGRVLLGQDGTPRLYHLTPELAAQKGLK